MDHTLFVVFVVAALLTHGWCLARQGWRIQELERQVKELRETSKHGR